MNDDIADTIVHDGVYNDNCAELIGWVVFTKIYSWHIHNLSNYRHSYSWGERKALGEDAEVEVLPNQIFNAIFKSKLHHFLVITITTRSIYTIGLEKFRLNKVHNLSVFYNSV